MDRKNPKLPVAVAALVMAAAVASAGWAGAAGAAPAVKGTHSAPALAACGQADVLKPKTVILACADGGILLKSLKWSHWGPSGASGSGLISWHICTPDCAASNKWGSSTATVKLTDLTEAGASRGWLFELLTAHITGAKTGGLSRTLKFPEKP